MISKLEVPEGRRTRTWLVAVMHGDECLTAEHLVGSRNYIPRLLELCHILVTNATSLQGYEVIMVRDNWRGELKNDDIRKFAAAYVAARLSYSSKEETQDGAKNRA